MQRFAIRIDRWMQPFLLLVGVKRSHAAVLVNAERLQVRFGTFRYTIRRTNLVSARQVQAKWSYGVGVHSNFVSNLIVNGSLHGLVELQLRQHQRAAILFIPVRYRRLFVSLEDPEAFLAALAVPSVAPAAQ